MFKWEYTNEQAQRPGIICVKRTEHSCALYKSSLFLLLLRTYPEGHYQYFHDYGVRCKLPKYPITQLPAKIAWMCQ